MKVKKLKIKGITSFMCLLSVVVFLFVPMNVFAENSVDNF